MRYKIFGLLGLLALGAFAAGLAAASPASAQGYGYGAPVAVPIEAAAAPEVSVSMPLDLEPVGTVAVAGPGVNEAPAPANMPAGCSLYDSWCAYCGNHPGADLCLQTAAQPAGTTAAPLLPQDVQPDPSTALLAAGSGVPSIAAAQ